ncbi:hypothetical protein VTN77DRAFT_6853 [Rasamsonia byssochlamydoides]|uniref:uncharacterized protein n=1 Tax=Rasamsonia byssochlamydoides TaxID=89139 RepID=UPI00374476D6
MSLNRVSYLESWEQHQLPFIRQRSAASAASYDGESGDVHVHDASEAAILSSSFPSSSRHRAVSHKLSFNPYAGRGWAHSSASAAAEADEERRSLLRSENGEANGSDRLTARGGEDAFPTELVFEDPNWNLAETRAAYEVSRGKRIAQVVAAVIYCLLAAGPVFGFAAIKPVFIREGVYRDQCSKEELGHGDGLCYEQETRLNLMFTIAAVATNICALPVGTVLDTYGPRVSGIIGSMFIAIGALLLAFAAHLPFDGYIPGYLFLALGGPFVFISSFHLSNSFPTRSGLILSVLTGAFDASSAIFLVFHLINEKTNGSFSIQKFFSIYLIVPFFILLVEIFLMPGASYKTAGELMIQVEKNIADEANDTVDESIPDREEGERQRQDRRAQRQNIVNNIRDLLDGSGKRKIDDLIFDSNVPEFASRSRGKSVARQKTSPIQPNQKHESGGVWGVMHGVSAFDQIRSLWFTLIALFTVLQMLRINYFVATIRSQYDYLLSSPELARRLNEVFDLALPVGGVISIPFIGTVLDNVPTAMVLFVLVTVSTIIGVLGCIPGSMSAGYTNIALFVLYRPFYYTAVSDYAAKVFGFQTFGKVYGLIICLAGISNFAQTGLDALTFEVFDRNPIPVNAILTVAVIVVGTALVSFVSWEARSLARVQAVVEPLAGGQYTEQNDGVYGAV